MNKNYELKDIAEIKNGSTPFTSDDTNYGGDIVWITPKDLTESKSKYIIQGERNITQKGYNSCSTTLLPKGTVLLSSRAPIGLLAISNTTLCTNQGFKNIIPDSQYLDNEYLYYFLKNRIKDIEALGSGTTFKEISKTSLEKYKLSIPDLKIQKNISNVLKTIDKKIEFNNKINAELEKMSKDLYNYWFVQFDFPDGNGRPYKSSGGKMVYNETLKRKIPEGWKVNFVKDYVNVITGKEDANFAIPNGKYAFFTCGDEVLKCNNPSFEGKAVLIAGNGNFNVKYFEGEFNAYQRTYVLLPENQKLVSLIYLSAIKQIQHFTKGSNGSIVKFITKAEVENIPILFPQNIDTIEVLNNIFTKIDKNLKENQLLAELRDFLLPMLMNGQITVADLLEDNI